jgi:transcriptional regulator with XRE-family HTH domain
MTCEVMEDAHAAPYDPLMTRSSAGPLVREWRLRRRRSQLDLAVEVGMSTRHLSYVETGRARPSPELLLTIADHLEVPLRERNALLLAAGYAPRYPQRSLDDPALASVRASVQRLLDAHDPFPGVAIDRAWDVVAANAGALRLVAGLPAELLGPPLNVYRAALHPDGLAARTANLRDWVTHLVGQLRRSAVLTGDPAVASLLDEVSGYPTVAPHLGHVDVAATADPPILVPLRLASPDGELALFTTLTTFGTPRDVTVDELSVELFFPADEATARVLRAQAASEATATAVSA